MGLMKTRVGFNGRMYRRPKLAKLENSGNANLKVGLINEKSVYVRLLGSATHEPKNKQDCQ